MTRQITEEDWKKYKILYPKALERFCTGVLDEINEIQMQKNLTAHEKYLKIYSLPRKRNKDLAVVFNDYRRSTALLQLGQMNSLDLREPEEIQEFSEETQQVINFLS